MNQVTIKVLVLFEINPKGSHRPAHGENSNHPRWGDQDDLANVFLYESGHPHP